MFTTFFYIAGLLVSILYGSAYLLSAYMRILRGGEINMANFLLVMGIGALLSVMFFNKALLKYFSALGVTIIGTATYSVGLLFLGMINTVSYTYPIALLMGLGWGLVYTASLIALNTNISLLRRKHHYSYYAATNALGAGMAPVIFRLLEHHNIDLQQFYFGAGLYLGLVAIVCLVIAGRFTNGKQNNLLYDSQPKAKLGAIERNVVILAFLSAGIFSTLTFFQISFAEIYQQNYAVFFTVLTLALIVSRLTLIHLISVHNNTLVYLSFMMLASTLMFPFIASHFFIYLISALLFGISYGLIYPLTQTIAIAYADECMHPSIISKFVLAYFIGIYCFPLACATVLVYINPHMIVILLIALALSYLAIAAKTLRIGTPLIIID